MIGEQEWPFLAGRTGDTLEPISNAIFQTGAPARAGLFQQELTGSVGNGGRVANMYVPALGSSGTFQF